MKTVLILDEKEIAEAIEDVLSIFIDEKLIFQSVQTAKEAEKILDDVVFNLAIINFSQGKRIIEKIKMRSDTKILCVSSSQEAEKLCLKAGCDAFLEKAINNNEKLAKEVKRLLNI